MKTTLKNSSTEPENIRLDEDVLKTSWRRLSSSSSEHIIKTSSRRLAQDEYICLSHMSSEDVLIKTNILILVICLLDVLPRHFQDVFKTSSIRLPKTSSRHFQYVLQKRLQDIFKTSSKRLQDILQRCLQDIFKTFWRRNLRLNCSLHVFKTSSRRIQHVFET